MALEPYSVSVVGSLPRPDWLLAAARRQREEQARLRDEACRLAIELQEEAGVDVLSDGEQRRDNFYSFLCERLSGLELMTMAQLLEYVEDKAAFEGLLRALDVPAFAIKNPTVVGKLERRTNLVLEDYRFVRAHTSRAVKVTLPGPYLLSRSIWVKGLSQEAYPTREALSDDIVRILREEILELAREGADVVQIDEPVLSELVFAGKSATRTFMCAALAASASPETELELAVELVNRVMDGVHGPVRALHVCRGNWSTKEEVLLAGSYDLLAPTLARMDVDQYVLEYATPRAGSLEALRTLPERASIGLGAVNPRTRAIETPEEIVARVRAAETVVGRGRVHLNPDCGFGTFAERPVATTETARKKLASLAAAARRLRA
jgi:5-methyltetrahydropteroyltriglutamate--homocysteine methyltransferase